VAVRTGLSDAEAQDVVQETILSVAKQMPGFQYDPALGSFKNWLLVVTRRRIADHLRKRDRDPARPGGQSQDASATAIMERVPDPARCRLEEVWDEEWEKNLLAAALTRLKGRVDARHFQIYDCYVLKQWPVKDVAKTFGVNAGQVYLVKHRLSTLVKEEIKLLEKQML
jgi:RNA polymerase sigma factor (sigma-70 family)